MKFIGKIQSLVTSTTDMAIGGVNRTAFEVYPSLPPGNAVMAPLNVSLTLAMAYLGARGETLQEMSRPLYLTEPWARHLGKEGARLGLTCGVWHKPEVVIEPAYLKALEAFKASARPLGAVRDAPNPLNPWIAAATEGKLVDFFPDRALQDAQALLVSTNRIQCPWAQPFQTSAVDNTKRVKQDGLMHYEGTLGFAGHEAFQILRVGCAAKDLSVCFMLPRERGGLNKLTESMTFKKFAAWLKELKDAPVSVSLPRFRVGSQIDLSDGLRALGLARTFTAGTADFSGMAPGLSMSRVLNQTQVLVNESGVEISAAAAVVFGPRAYLTDRVAESHPDHPFQFFVREKSTGTLLAMGRGDAGGASS